MQSACPNPKLLGVSVMVKYEEISTALSVLLPRFKSLPQACYYDNDCNMRKSILLRVLWVAEECLVVCDRIHYRAHACNSNWDPDSHSFFRNHCTSGPEAINCLLGFSKSHLLFLSSDNLMPFLAARSIFISLLAMIRMKEKKADINAKVFCRTISEMWLCDCSRSLK